MRSRDFLAALGAAIRTRRIELGLSQEELADSIGLHRTYIGGVERGERNLGVENLARFARGLRLKVSELAAAAEGIRTSSRGTGK